MEESEANVVLCADARYAPGAWVAIWSVFRHWKGRQKLVFHLLTKDVRAPLILRMQSLAASAGIDLRVHEAKMESGNLSMQLGEAAYHRLLAPVLLSQCKNLLYIDSDLMARTSLHPLFELSTEAPCSAVVDYGMRDVNEGLPYLKLEGERARQPYFNTGVLVINVPVWNAKNLTTEILSYLQRYKVENIYSDQDGINAMLIGEMNELDYSWNFQIGAFDYLDTIGWPAERQALLKRRDDLLKYAKIAHYLFKNPKPWQEHFVAAYASEYRTNLRTSGWHPFGEQLSMSLKWAFSDIWQGLRRIKATLFKPTPATAHPSK